MKIFIAQMNSTVGDFEGNFQKMLGLLKKAGPADLVVFPECALCGYPPQDLLDYESFGKKAEAYNQKLIRAASDKSFIFGTIERNKGKGRNFFNTAIFASKGKKSGTYYKRLLPTYDVFDEDRFFEPGKKPLIISWGGEKVAITICEDIWSESLLTQLQNRYAAKPLQDCKQATLFINISASPFEYKKVSAKQEMLKTVARRYRKNFIYVNTVGANDSIIFDGRSMVWSAEGKLIKEAKAFEEDLIEVALSSPFPLLVAPSERFEPKEGVLSGSPSFVRRGLGEVENIYNAILLGIRDYCHKQGFSKALLGLSGGIDSAVVACLASDALGAENVSVVLMPSRYTSKESNEDALALAKATQNPVHLLPIELSFQAHLKTLEKSFEGLDVDVTEENLQARLRGSLLMALSNKFGSLLLTTGNKSELAVGYCTLYGDMCGGLAPLADVYKTQVYALGREANRRTMRIPERVFQKAPTAELRHNQTDQDKLPPYEELDKILKGVIEGFLMEEELIRRGHKKEQVQKVIQWLGRSEYKRYQMPLGLKVSSKAYGIGRRMPLVHKFF